MKKDTSGKSPDNKVENSDSKIILTLTIQGAKQQEVYKWISAHAFVRLQRCFLLLTLFLFHNTNQHSFPSHMSIVSL